MMTRNRFILSVLAILSAASSACSVYVDSSREQCKQNSDCTALGSQYAGYLCKDSVCQPPQEQCKQDGDCAALGSQYAGYFCKDSVCQPPVDPTWACLDKPTITEPPSGNVRVALILVDLLSQRPLVGASLALCAKLDAACSWPISQYQSNAAGQIEVEMPAGIDVYFQVEGAGVQPTLLFPPSTRKQRAPSTIPMVPATFYPTLIRGAASGVAADRSVILTTALDCLGRPAAGVTPSSPQADNQTIVYVLAGGMPASTPLVTDETGGGGFLNIPAGSVLVNSTLAANNRLIGTAGVQTRPGHISMVLIMPNGN